jgi:hypothetical protein
MKAPLSDIRVQWKDIQFNNVPILSRDIRFNVFKFKYTNGVLKKLEEKDNRKWSFSQINNGQRTRKQQLHFLEYNFVFWNYFCIFAA